MKKINKILLLFYFLFIQAVLFAHPGDLEDNLDNPENLEGDDVAAPIDDYILLLAIIGIIYVFYYIRKYNKLSNIN